MHPQLAAALGRLDSVTRDLHTIAGSMPSPLRSQQPAAGRWCVNEVLEHVCMVEQLFVARLIANIEAAKAAGLASEVETPAMLPEQLGSVVEDRSARRTAPDAVQPTGQVESAAALDGIEACHARLRDAIASADGLALSTVTHDHRFFGTLNVYQWVDLIAGHERRHLAQIREIAADCGAGH
jgi:hypothetical protein